MSLKTWTDRVRTWMSKATVEPFLFLVMLGFNVRLVSLQSLFHDRACRVSLRYDDDVCDDMDDMAHDAQQIDALTQGNNLYNAFVIASTVPALVVASFLGPWGDRYSRKYPLLLATVGILVDSCVQCIIASFPTASPHWFLASAAVTGCCGGLVIVVSSTYSYMSDITDEKSRQTRYAVLEFFTILATPIGSLMGGQVFRAGGHLAVLAVGPCAFALALAWLRMCVLETKPRRVDLKLKDMLREIFRLDNVREAYRTCAKRRVGNIRMQIWLLVAVSFSVRLVHMGSLSIGFPFTRHSFKWDVARYSYTTAAFSLLNAAAALLLVRLFSRRLRLHGAAVGLVGVLSLAAKMVIMASAVHEILVSYAWFAGTLYACGSIAVRSRLSKLVSNQELGKVFSLLATCESLTPVLGTISMTQIYNYSLHFYPGLAFAVAAIFLIPAACIFTWMMGLPTSAIAYQESEQAKVTKELKNIADMAVLITEDCPSVS